MKVGDIVIIKTYVSRLGRVKELPKTYGGVYKISVSEATYAKTFYSSIREIHNGDVLHIAMKYDIANRKLDDFERKLYKELKLKFYIKAL